MKRIACLVVALSMAGCAFPATKAGMVVLDYSAPKQIGDKIYVKESTGGSVTLPFWVSKIPNDNFTAAVRESLIHSKAFSALSKSWGDDWGLALEILDVDQPFIGTDFTVSTSIKYTLYRGGQKVYETTVRESGKATISEALFGVKRLRLANEHSARANIRKFIEELSQQNLEP
jgi:hypothetical protein